MRLSILPVVLLVLSSSVADAQLLRRPPDLPDRIKTCTPAHVKLGALCLDEDAAIELGTLPVQSLYNAGRFEQLDTLYARWCTGADRMPDGRWMLINFADGLGTLFDAWKTWDRDLSRVQNWQTLRPASTAARYAEAILWRRYAWNARGTGSAGTVSREAVALFEERLKKADRILEDLRRSGEQCPAVWATSLAVQIDRGASLQQLEAVFTEAVRRWPEYHSLYFMMSRRLEPKWGGSVEAYERFADAAAARTSAFEGMGMYARLYWLVDDRGALAFKSGNDRSPPSWDKLHAGYEDLVRKYPSSMHTLTRYADVACRSNDGALYRRLRTRIDGYETLEAMAEPVEACDLHHHWSAASEPAVR
jgi:hypothetical protein